MSERMDNKGIPIIESSGDVFADLDIQLDEKDKLKNAIALEITRLIEDRKLTQKDVSVLLKTDQAKVSQITRGRLNGFSVDRLLTFLVALGLNVDIHLTENKNHQGKVTVHAAYG